MIAETQEHRIDLGTILKVAREKNATDIHLQVGLPPSCVFRKSWWLSAPRNSRPNAWRNSCSPS